MGTSGAKRAILIAGPTASGKSALAVMLAERHGGTVINADSMQVYADLAILTARPTAADTARVPHRLFGHVDAADAYSVGRWLTEMRDVLDEVAAAGRLPVIVGGTGLYLKALMEGLAEMPPVPPDLRARLRDEARDAPPGELHARLAAVDPVMAARLRPSDPQRLMRALEIFAATGRSLASFQLARTNPVLPPDQVGGVFLDIPRAALNARIDQRFAAMMAAGALDEVAALDERILDPTLPAMRALGVPQLLPALREPELLPEAVASATRASRHYAKRQVTYARHQLPNLPWSGPAEASDVIDHQLALARAQ